VDRELERALSAVMAAAEGEDAAAALAAMEGLARIRERIDLAERALIEVARAGGVSWAAVAEALGLRSRQAAEQRFLRLAALPRRDPAPMREVRRRQRFVDGEPIAALRRAARALLRRVESDGDWDTRFRRAELVRRSLEIAVEAPPGSLYELVTLVVEDLAEVSLPAAAAPAAAELAAARAAATQP